MGDSGAIEVTVLGRIGSTDPEADAALGRGRARELLGLLVAARGPLRTDRIIDEIWPDEPPATAATIIHGLIRRLRSALGAEAIVHEVGGYRLALPASAVDLWIAEDAVLAGDHRRARTIWSEPPFGHCSDRSWAREALARRPHLEGISADGTGVVRPNRRAPTGRLIGRRRELATVTAALGRNRLVTIVGLGGVGKSRLALEALATTRRSVAVDLGSGAGPVIGRVADGLGIIATGRPSWDRRTVASVLGGDDVTLLLDACEHAPSEAAAEIEELLDTCPHLRVLATSRSALGIPGEQVVPILPFADPGARHGDSMALLRERMSVLGLSVDLVGSDRLAAICERTAGVPLAIELAVADAVFGPAESDGSGAAPRGRPAPGDAMKASVERSLDGLTPSAGKVAHRLARLVDGTTPRVLAALCEEAASPIGILYELVSSGLMADKAASSTRRLHLPDPVRHLLLDRPDAGALDDVTGALGGVLAEARPDPAQPIRIEALPAGIAELTNVEALLPDLVAAGDVGVALRLVRSAAECWREAGSWLRGSAAIDAVLAAGRPAGATSADLSGNDPGVVDVEPIDWAGGVWAEAYVSATYAASSAELGRLSEAVAIAEREGDIALETYLRYLVAIGAGYAGRLRDALDQREVLGGLVEQLDSEFGRVMLGQFDALADLVAGRPIDAAASLEALASRAEEIGALADAARTLRLAGMALRTAGDLASARSRLEGAEALALEAGSAGTLAIIRTDIVDMRHTAGELDRRTIVEALDSVVAVGNLRSAGRLRLRLATIDSDLAGLAHATLDLLESDGAWAAVALAELVDRLPTADPIRRMAPQAIAHLRRSGSPLGPLELAHLDAVIAGTGSHCEPGEADLKGLRSVLQDVVGDRDSSEALRA